MNEEDIEFVIEEVVNDTEIEKSDRELETYPSKEELKFPQEYDEGGIIILGDKNEKVLKHSRLQTMFKSSRHNILSILIISQDYYELPKGTIRANGNIYHTFKPNNLRNLQNKYPDKASVGMTLNEFELLTNTSLIEKFQSLTIEMTKDKHVVRYRLGLNSIFVLYHCPFLTT